MVYHLFSKMVLALATLLILANLAVSNPQFATAYYRQAFPSYFQPVPDSFNHQLYGLHFQPYFGPYVIPGEVSNEFSSIMESYEQDENPFAYTFGACPRPRVLVPCKCFRSPTPWSFPAGNIVCPALTSAQTKSIFSNIPAGKNIQTVTLNLPRGTSKTNSLPATFLANNPQAVINIISPNDASCIDNTLLSPCTCAGDTITCPPGISLTQIQAVFNKIAPNTNLGNVVINLPAGINALPANFFGTNAANTITLIGTGARALSQLTIDANAFTASAATCTLFTIQLFDISNLDYSFLAGFNVLTKLLLNQCTVGANPLKNLPNLPNLVVLVDGAVYNRKCFNAAVLSPCTCAVPTGAQEVTITCPPGTTNQQIKTAFQNLPANSNIGNVILNFPLATTTAIPADILGNGKASTIQLIGPTQPTLSKLTIDVNSFTSSATTDTQFWVVNFDLASLDYSFLANFNALTTVAINKCTNAPSKGNPPKNLPNLPKLVSVLVDGVDFNSLCPASISLALAPCTCAFPAGSQVYTINCPTGTSIAQIQKSFNNLPPKSNVGNVILNIPAGNNEIPKNLLGNNAATTITLIGLAGNPLSKLTINSEAFLASAGTGTLFTIEQFDVGTLNYQFLRDFDILTKVMLNKCANNPTVANPPRRLPRIAKLISVFVDGVPYRLRCPSAPLLAPCLCTADLEANPKFATSDITCPAEAIIQQLKTIFTNLPADSNLASIEINFPSAASTVIPESFLGNSAIVFLTFTGSTAGKELSKLAIDAKAFSSTSADRMSVFTVNTFDVGNLDYRFLTGFNTLFNINFNKCTNPPGPNNPPETLPNLTSLETITSDGTIYKISKCPPEASLTPCSCVESFGKLNRITCPKGATIQQIQDVFKKLPVDSKIGNVILGNLPVGATTTIPASMLADKAAKTVVLIGPEGNPYSKVLIDSKAFTSSANSLEKFSLVGFDVANVDYSFLSNFGELTTINFEDCVNTPTAANPLKTLPKLPKSVSIFVDGLLYNAQCPDPKVIAPCYCNTLEELSFCIITCPDNTAQQMQDAFKNVPANSNLGQLELHFSVAPTINIPASLLGKNPASAILLIGPAGPTRSKLVIDAGAFAPSATLATYVQIKNFDIADVDFSFLANFNSLVTVSITKCTNAPKKRSDLKKFPTNLPKLLVISVDGLGNIIRT